MGVGQAYPVSAGYRKRVQADEKPSKFNNLLGLVQPLRAAGLGRLEEPTHGHALATQQLTVLRTEDEPLRDASCRGPALEADEFAPETDCSEDRFP